MKKRAKLTVLGMTALVAFLSSIGQSAAADVREPIRPFGKSGLLVMPKLGSYKTRTTTCAAGSTGDLVFLYETARKVGSKRKTGWAIYRSTRTGRPKPRFGRSGVVRQISGLDGKPVKVIVDAGGGTIVAFETKRTATASARVVLVRLNARGRRDSNFANNGVADTGLTSTSDIQELKQLPDGTLAVVQHSSGGSSPTSGSVVIVGVSGHVEVSITTFSGVNGEDRFHPTSIAYASGSLFVVGKLFTQIGNSRSSRGAVFKLDRRGVADVTWGTLGRTLVGGDPSPFVNRRLRIHASPEGSLAVTGSDTLEGDQEEWIEHWTMSIDPTGAAVPNSRIVVFEEYDLLNELDPQPENFDLVIAMNEAGRFVVAGFGDGKERLSIRGGSIRRGSNLESFRRRSPKDFDVATGDAAITDDGALLACGDRLTRRSWSAAAFKMRLP